MEMNSNTFCKVTFLTFCLSPLPITYNSHFRMTSIVAKSNGDDVTLINPGGGNSMMWHHMRNDVTLHPVPSSLRICSDMDNKENVMNDVHQNYELNQENRKS